MADEKQQASSLIRETVQSPDFKEMYSNHTRLAMTPYDLVMTFGHIIEKTPAHPVVSEDVTIRFSPQSFKFLVLNVAAAMAAWEAQFGSVEIRNRSPDAIAAALKESANKLKRDFFEAKEAKKES